MLVFAFGDFSVRDFLGDRLLQLETSCRSSDTDGVGEHHRDDHDPVRLGSNEGYTYVRKYPVPAS
ncbi:MAG: hypothetical protein ABL888_19445 [Pirellulaceae bacterium]